MKFAGKLHYFKRVFACDSVDIKEIVHGYDCVKHRRDVTLHLLLGTKRSTKDNRGVYWSRVTSAAGERVDFEYFEWKTVASGKNIQELLASARAYKRLLQPDWGKP